MQIAEKKLAAALAAVQLYMQLEEDALRCQTEAACSRVMPVEPGQWALAGRSEMMGARRLVQMRAFSSAR